MLPKRRLLFILSYLLLAAVIAAMTFVLIRIGQGYTYNFRTHRFTLQGLLVVSSVPGNASVRVNGQLIRRKTPYRATVEAGTYNVEVSKEGYRPWQKSLTVAVSEVTAAPYILLLPKDIKTTSMVGGGGGLVSTPDRRHFAYLTATPESAVWLLNADKREGVKIYTAKAASADQPAETLESITWSNDGSHILVKSQVGPTPTYAVIAAAPGSTAVNLTETFKYDFGGLQFSPNNWRELYWISPEGLRRVDIEARNVSAVLAEKISAYTFAGDRIIYIQTTSLGKTVWSVDRSGRDAKRLLESLAESDSYEMQYTNYRGKDWLAILPHKAATATIYGDIFSPTPEARVVSKVADHINFSEDGHYLAFSAANNFGTFDLDKNRVVAVGTEGLSSLNWYDAYHLILTKNDRLYMAEFDGANLTEIALAAGPGFASADQRQVLFLRTSTGSGGLEIASAEVRR